MIIDLEWLPYLGPTPADALVAPFRYPSAGHPVRGLLVTPASPGPHPCVLFARGGFGDSGAITPELGLATLLTLAGWGYATIASQYRGTHGEPGADTFGAREVDDLLALLPIIDALPQIDAARLGLWGWSRGGLMACQLLTRCDRFRAAVIVAGLFDAFDYAARRPDMVASVFATLADYQADSAAALHHRSPIRWAEQLAPTPLLLLHGAADWRIDAAQSLALAARLHALKRPYQLLICEGGDHALTQHQDTVAALARPWLKRFLND